MKNGRFLFAAAALAALAFACTAGRSLCAASDGSDEGSYTIQDLEGDVTLLPAGQDRPVLAREGVELNEGDQLRVGADSEATLTLGDDQVVRLEPGTKVTLDRSREIGTTGFWSRFKLAAGDLMAEAKHLLEKRSKFEVAAGGVVCGVRGTVFEVGQAGQKTQVLTYEGNVAADGPGVSESVGSGQCGVLLKGQKMRRRALTPKEKARLALWRKFREAIREKRQARLENRLQTLKSDLQNLRNQLRSCRPLAGRGADGKPVKHLPPRGRR